MLVNSVHKEKLDFNISSSLKELFLGTTEPHFHVLFVYRFLISVIYAWASSRPVPPKCLDVEWLTKYSYQILRWYKMNIIKWNHVQVIARMCFLGFIFSFAVISFRFLIWKGAFKNILFVWLWQTFSIPQVQASGCRLTWLLKHRVWSTITESWNVFSDLFKENNISGHCVMFC